MSYKKQKRKAKVFYSYAKSVSLILAGLTGLIMAIAELIKKL
ncbi:hypothetical protein SAMN02910447_03011 [Ruminococcus sp. YE71]|nr:MULTISPECIES: hypothetical protein [unclassified Ruminococcus]SDA29285.1 hypothetical protein SAMN02910446_03082 [Ruminococcus sp. YE78]SFW47918.1 hypothetical protein SAMN02910447_03011 [Ruminococcus sp. YE71]